MTGALLARQFELNHRVTHRNIQDVTHEESLVPPAPAGNCLNWVLGHVLATRNLVLASLGEPPVLDAAKAAPYERGATPPLPVEDALRLEEIVAALDCSQTTIASKMPALEDGALAQIFSGPPPLGTTSLGERLATLSFHEAYHVGQCGLLRRLLGKANAIG